jgi:DNA-binding LacI/PurR family transcriptional regulator
MSEATPIYLKIRQHVFGNIAKAKFVGGSLKIHTEDELCKIYGVCRTTVRKALESLVAEGFLVRKPRLGTFIRPEAVGNYSMFFGNKPVIGLICCDGMVTFMDEYFMMLSAIIYERLIDNNCIIRPIYFSGNPEQEAEDLSKGKLDGVLWLSPLRKQIPTMRVFESCNVPVVSVCPIFNSNEVDYVAIDYFKCGYIVAKYLLESGHRKILYINRNPADLEADKKTGCKAAFAEYGVEWNEHLWHCNDNGFTDAQVINLLNNSGKFTAVNCHGIHVNLLKQELAERKDVQFIYNIYREPAVSRDIRPGILLPLTQIGNIATDMLLKIIKQSNPSRRKPKRLLLEPTIAGRNKI